MRYARRALTLFAGLVGCLILAACGVSETAVTAGAAASAKAKEAEQAQQQIQQVQQKLDEAAAQAQAQKDAIDQATK